MKVKTVVSFAIVAALFTGVGFFFGSQDLSDSENQGASNSDIDALQKDRQRLRDELAKSQRRLAQLEKDQQDFAALRASRGRSSQGTSSLPGSGTAVLDSSSQGAQLSATIERLQRELESARKKLQPMSDAELAAKVDEIQSNFEVALKGKDALGALAAMKALKALDSRAFPTVLKLWDALRKEDYLGLGKRERRALIDPAVMHWALSTEDLGLDEKLTARFQGAALRALRKLDGGDPEKLTKSYLAYMGRLGEPGALPEPDAKTGKRARDSYRQALRELSRVESPESARYLSGILGKNGYPEDVRLTALRGIARQADSSEEALKAVEDATFDTDPKIKSAAILVKKQLEAPVPGVFITKVRSDGQGHSLGIPVGGIIVSYNGQEVRDSGDIKRARKRAKDEFSVVKVQVNGEIREYKIKSGSRLGVDGNEVKGQGQ
ncbi:MAG: hypothetical protein P1V97_18275 [Planctomycetota bacterium]|nr:hypothetical protein [Planctomycetota bacterium]